MKIAVITPGFMPVPAVVGGAVESLITNLIDENEKKGKLEIVIYTIFHKSIVSNYKYSQIVQYKKNFRNRAYYKLINKINGKQSVFYYDRIVAELQKNWKNFDYIIVENNIDLLIQILASLPYILQKKIVYHFHNDINTLEYSKEKFEFICSYKIPVITVSNYVKQHILCFFPNMSIFVLRNSIDLCQFNIENVQRNKIRNLYNIKEDVRVIMFSGRIVEYKGILELLYAYQQILKNGYINTRLMIVGSYNNINGADDAFTMLVKHKALECGKRVIFTGFVDHTQIQNYYAAADIVVVPSKCNESAGLVPLEAQAMGKPVIVTKVGGIPEYETYGSCCFIENNENLTEEIAKNLQRLLTDENMLLKVVKCGLENVKKYNSKNYLENFCHILNLIKKEHNQKCE